MRSPTILEHVAEVGSTSDVLKQRAEAGGGEAALLADRQTAGRGRLGRGWVSPPGNLHLSVLLRPGTPFHPGHWSILAAVAMARVAAGYAEGIRLKWPNDVMLHGAKLAGILLEADGQAGWLVIGFGANLVHAPPGLGRPVAVLGQHTRAPGARDVATALLAEIGHWRQTYAREGFDPVRAAWLALGPVPGSRVTVGSPGGQIEGRFHGLGPDGALLLDQDGVLLTVRSGEVE